MQDTNPNDRIALLIGRQAMTIETLAAELTVMKRAEELRQSQTKRKTSARPKSAGTDNRV